MLFRSFPIHVDSPAFTRRRNPASSGFTLIELVVTLGLVSILAVVVVPRLSTLLTFSARGFSDQVRSAVQYAQKLAMAQRRNVCVTVATGSVSLTKAASAGSAVACTVAVGNPFGSGNFLLTTPSGVSLASSGTIAFDALGANAASANITVTGDSTYQIVVESATGYVH